MMARACLPFVPYITHEEGEQIRRIALMKTLIGHKPDSRRKFVTSLYFSVRRMMITHQRTEFRKRRLMRKVREAPPGPVESRPFEDLEARLDAQEVAGRLLAHLDDRERAVVDMRFRDDMTFKRIGEALSMSPEEAAGVYHAAMAKMKKKADRQFQEFC